MGMSDAHKAALAEGRRQGRAIRAYLAALGERRPGRPVTAESVRAKLDRIERSLEKESDPLARVELIQARKDAEEKAAAVEAQVDLATLEEGFVANAEAYSQRKGVSYRAWREVGVPAVVLKRAGMARGG